MEKKLPGIFANKIDKNVNNNKTVYYSKLDEKEENLRTEKKENLKPTSNLNVNQKINKIFSSTKYVYKADVKITLENEQIECRIIGRNANHLITIENKLIPISSIVDIDFIDNKK